MIKRSVAIGAAAACVAAGAALTFAPSAATAASSGAVSRDALGSAWGTDGKVYSMTEVGNTIYLAGTFKNLVNPKTGIKQPAANIGAINATTGKPITTLRREHQRPDLLGPRLGRRFDLVRRWRLQRCGRCGPQEPGRLQHRHRRHHQLGTQGDRRRPGGAPDR